LPKPCDPYKNFGKGRQSCSWVVKASGWESDGVRTLAPPGNLWPWIASSTIPSLSVSLMKKFTRCTSKDFDKILRFLILVKLFNFVCHIWIDAISIKGINRQTSYLTVIKNCCQPQNPFEARNLCFQIFIQILFSLSIFGCVLDDWSQLYPSKSILYWNS